MDHSKHGGFCCKELGFFIAEQKIAVTYAAATRELGILSLDGGYYQHAPFCPFCGTEQPKSLRYEWEDALDLIGYDWSTHSDENLPEAYRSDEWWKQKGR